MTIETSTEYVKRKLQEPQLNIASLCRELGLNRSRMYRLINGADIKSSAIDKLFAYFKKMNE